MTATFSSWPRGHAPGQAHLWVSLTLLSLGTPRRRWSLRHWARADPGPQGGRAPASGRALPREGGLLDDTRNWLLLDCTVVAVQDTEDVADDVAITTLFASMKASWKLYKHFFLAALFLSLLSGIAAVSLLDGGGRASGLASESVGPNKSLPSEKNGKINASKRHRLRSNLKSSY